MNLCQATDRLTPLGVGYQTLNFNYQILLFMTCLLFTGLLFVLDTMAQSYRPKIQKNFLYSVLKLKFLKILPDI
jgi:hypothetical protein